MAPEASGRVETLRPAGPSGTVRLRPMTANPGRSNETDPETRLELTADPLPVEGLTRWVARPDCGAVVVFCGNARDHAEGRPGVTALEYEAYDAQVVPRLGRIADEARRRWPDLGRVALVHRTGPLEVGEAAVVVAVSSPHRDTAFEAGRWCIDTLKATVPIWKSEMWDGGESWGMDAQHVVDVEGSNGPVGGVAR